MADTLLIGQVDAGDPSIFTKLLAKKMDARVKPAHDRI